MTPVIKQIKKGTIIIIAQYYKTFDFIPIICIVVKNGYTLNVGSNDTWSESFLWVKNAMSMRVSGVNLQTVKIRLNNTTLTYYKPHKSSAQNRTYYTDALLYSFLRS